MKTRVLTFSLMLSAFAAGAYAVPTLSFQVDGGATTFCADESACDLAIGVPGVVNVSQSLPGGFIVNITTGITKPVFGGAHMDLNSVDVQATGGTHDLVLGFSENGFNNAPSGLLGSFGGTLTFGAGSTVNGQAHYDTANTLFTGPLSFTIGPFGPGAFSGDKSGPGPATNPFSMTEYINLHTVGAGSFSGDFDLQAVPEPISVSLLGGILLFVAGGVRRRLHKG
jgi:hypothetical protein